MLCVPRSPHRVCPASARVLSQANLPRPAGCQHGRYEGKAFGEGAPEQEAAAWLRLHGAVLAQEGACRAPMQGFWV